MMSKKKEIAITIGLLIGGIFLWGFIFGGVLGVGK